MHVHPHFAEERGENEEVDEVGYGEGSSSHNEDDFTFQMVSDLHLEVEGTIDAIGEIPQNSKYLMLLGDIGYPNQQVYRDFVRKQSERFEAVFLLAGAILRANPFPEVTDPFCRLPLPTLSH
eukprot:TRINITY_DN6965_c0_g1_i1.p1 TRINITY_DN6965_c0_g1~~TRINITY_DN6965_c0_g1_i1.p1  ORF type:complete len:122 (+),score=23.58 TRINITY_DN6965_c0_g1_i1:151-516(+)